MSHGSEGKTLPSEGIHDDRRMLYGRCKLDFHCLLLLLSCYSDSSGQPLSITNLVIIGTYWIELEIW